MKPLGNPVSIMATSVMAHETVNIECIQRPYHDVFQVKRIICPESQCVEKLLFFEENGLGQHYRVIHKKDADLANASHTMRYLYGKETLRYIGILSERNSKVSN